MIGSMVATPGYIPSAIAFLKAAQIRTRVECAALNQLVYALKKNGTWSKYHAIYPFIGGNAAAHSLNLKSPTQYQITWGGMVTHNSSGITGALMGYGNTGYVPSVNATLGNNHISVYCLTNKSSSNTIEMGVKTGTDSPSWAEWGLQLKNAGLLYPFLIGGDFNDYPNIASTDSRGWIVAARASQTTIQGYRNGSLILSSNQNQTILPSQPIAVLAQRNSMGLERYSPVTLGSATIGENLTAAEIAADYAAFQTYQTTLGRQV